MPNDEQIKLITIAEAAIITHRTRATVYKWIYSGQLEAHDTIDGLRVDGRTALAVVSAQRDRRRNTPKKKAA